MNECLSLQYVDILIQNGHILQLIGMYNLCKSINEYINRDDKLKILSYRLGYPQFSTFAQMMNYYFNKFSLEEQVDLSLNNINISNLLADKLYMNQVKYNDVIRYLLRKLHTFSHMNDYSRLHTLGMLFEAMQYELTERDTVYISNIGRAMDELDHGRTLFNNHRLCLIKLEKFISNVNQIMNFNNNRNCYNYGQVIKLINNYNLPFPFPASRLELIKNANTFQNNIVILIDLINSIK